jgi:hypothetical protein
VKPRSARRSAALHRQADRRGTGLRLSITYDIVAKQHGGTIAAESFPDATIHGRVAIGPARGLVSFKLLRGIFPSIKRRIGGFAGLSAGRRWEKFRSAETEHGAFCQSELAARGAPVLHLLLTYSVRAAPNANGFPENKVPLNALRSAIRTCRRLAISYVNGEGNQTQRVIWPIQLGFMDSARVVTGWCELRKAFRFFRTDRISSAEIGDRYPARRADLIRDFYAQLNDEDSAGKSPDRN